MTVKKSRRLSPEEVGMIRALWEQGAMTVSQIAEEIGVKEDQVKYQIKKSGWVQGSRAEYYENIAVRAIEEQMAGKAKKMAVAKDTAREKALQLANVVEGRLIKLIKEADSKGLTDAAILHDYKGLEVASKVIQNTFHTKRFALGMDKEEPETTEQNNLIQLAEMTAEEVEEIRDSQEQAWRELGVDDED